MKDLVLMVADKNMNFALKGALSRPDALGIAPIEFEFRTHMGRDGGVRTSGPETLALDSRRFSHALLVFDLEGSGASIADAKLVEEELDRRLSTHWDDRAKSIVIEPELDIWIWGSDNILQDVLEWPIPGSIREWLKNRGFEFNESGKPLRPKEALDELRPVHRLPRSSALYEKITSKISIKKCSDPAFSRLREQLQIWFPLKNR